MAGAPAKARDTMLEFMRRRRGHGPKVVITAAMLGSVGVGKTTLLASMYERFADVVGSIALDIRPNRETSLQLQTYIDTLQQLPADVKVEAALDGTREVRRHNFAVGSTGQQPVFTLQFIDYSGQYVTHKDYEFREQVSQALAASDVMLVAIDAPALIEENGRFHTRINADMQVTHEIKELLSRSADSKLIILTLLKCETYLLTEQSTKRLIDRVTEAYHPLLSYIGTDAIRPRVGCVLAAVKTIGPIKLYEIDSTNPEKLVFRFRTTKVNAVYAPEDTDQPLRYLLRFVINKYRSESRPAYRVIWDRITGLDANFEAAVDSFTQGCKDAGGIVVLQDHPLLHMPRSRPARTR
jgi:hypothetical protein